MSFSLFVVQNNNPFILVHKILLMPKMEPTLVFLELQYLRKIQQEFTRLYNSNFTVDYRQFAITLAKSQGLWLKEGFIYGAPPYQSPQPSADENSRRKKYDKVMNCYKGIADFHVREGRCQKINGDYHEKGVDTLLTMDLMTVLGKKDVKTIIILACDTDYVPVIKKLRENGFEVILFHYTDRIRNSNFSLSNHIQNSCDKCVLLEREHFEKSLYNPNHRSEV